MKIEHIALWVLDLEAMRRFYETYFGAVSNDKYENPTKGFQSYFLSFDSGTRIELMRMEGLNKRCSESQSNHLGLAHFAFSLGSKAAVDQMTKRLSEQGFRIVDGPRTTGDGYYESVVLDPEQNRIELTL